MKLANIDRNEDMAIKGTQARHNTYHEQMKEEVDYDFANIAVLTSQHNTRCFEMMNNPKK